MRNLFAKNDHKPLVVGILLGALATGAAVYFFYDDVAEFISTLLGKEQTVETAEDSQAYLHHKIKAPKTDREKLLEGEILHQPEVIERHEEQPN